MWPEGTGREWTEFLREIIRPKMVAVAAVGLPKLDVEKPETDHA